MNKRSKVELKGIPFTFERMSPLSPNSDPASEDVDWFHTYTVINNDVYVFDYGQEDKTEYIIIAHKPTGTRFKIRFTTNVFQFEGMAHIPRSILDSNLERARETRSRELGDAIDLDLKIVEGEDGEKVISAGALNYDDTDVKLTDEQVNVEIDKMEEETEPPKPSLTDFVDEAVTDPAEVANSDTSNVE